MSIGGIFIYAAIFGYIIFNYFKMKKLKETNPEEYAKLMEANKKSAKTHEFSDYTTSIRHAGMPGNVHHHSRH